MCISGTSSEKREQRINDLLNCLLAIIQKNINNSQCFNFLYKNVIMYIYKVAIETTTFSGSVLHSTGIINKFSTCIQCIIVRCNQRLVTIFIFFFIIDITYHKHKCFLSVNFHKLIYISKAFNLC